MRMQWVKRFKLKMRRSTVRYMILGIKRYHVPMFLAIRTDGACSLAAPYTAEAFDKSDFFRCQANLRAEIEVVEPRMPSNTPLDVLGVSFVHFVRDGIPFNLRDSLFAAITMPLCSFV